MAYLVATCFDKKTWQEFGLNWLRTAKSLKLKGIVIGDGLANEAVTKIKELGFDHVPILVKCNPVIDRYYTLASVLSPDQWCLLTHPSVLPRIGLSGMSCAVEKIPAMELVGSIRSLTDRAKSFSLIQEKIEKEYHGVFSMKCVLGDGYFWNMLAGFQTYLFENKYFDRPNFCVEMSFNLYMALTEAKPEICHD